MFYNNEKNNFSWLDVMQQGKMSAKHQGFCRGADDLWIHYWRYGKLQMKEIYHWNFWLGTIEVWKCHKGLNIMGVPLSTASSKYI
jgi:hypothetical protein